MKNLSKIFLNFYSNFDLKYFLKNTGVNAKTEKIPNKRVDCHENASAELVIWYKVLPAWIAMNDGGATPATMKIICLKQWKIVKLN